MSRKDSRGMFANVLGPIDQAPARVQPTKSPSPHLMKVAAGVRQMQEKGEVLDRLLKDGDHIVDLDPADIAQSNILDRFEGAYELAAINELSASMNARGQIVPGLVRPVSSGSHRYQIVYGRRRLAAAKSLGIPFRAVIRDLTDDEAIVYQGEENTNRNDLSFIEKCAFALLQENAGFGRDVISASLSTGKSHISEMIGIASAVPRETLLDIGPSADVGRRRWLEFVTFWSARTDAREIVAEALAGLQPASGERFTAALSALQSDRKTLVAAPTAVEEIRANGFLLATVSYPKSGAKISFTRSVPPTFVEFLNSRMAALHDEFVGQYQVKKKDR